MRRGRAGWRMAGICYDRRLKTHSMASQSSTEAGAPQAGAPITSAAPIGWGEKLRELASIFFMRLAEGKRSEPSGGLLADLDEYEELLRKYCALELKGSRGFEVGFGARPLRLLALAARGADVTGADLDVPLLRCSPGEILQMIRRNGVERAVKSVIRFWAFDLAERRALRRALRRRGFDLKIESKRLRIGDAAHMKIPARSLDFIYSEDVFEHIPIAALPGLVSKMAQWLKPEGVAMIRPNVFPGIVGGHLAEWFPNVVADRNRRRRSEPWEHLRKRRFRPNTYVNELARADYRELFAMHFEILEERVRHPGLGREYLTPAVAAELSDWADEELFSNQTLFVLRPLPR
jgi:hypothetical protein